MDDIQRDLVGYLQRVKAGERLLILEEDEPIIEITPVTARRDALRPYALCAGAFSISDDFDEALPDALLAPFIE